MDQTASGRRRGWRALTCSRLLPIVLALLALFIFSTIAPGIIRAGSRNLDGVVNLNTASSELLSLLPGIGPSKAQQIVSYRARHAFRTVDELVRVKGIGRRMVREMRSHLAVAGPSTAHAGSAHVDSPSVPIAAPPRPLCLPRAVPSPPLPTRPLQRPRERPILSVGNHCAPPA